MNFFVREYQPSAPLRPYVDCYWEGAFNLKAEETVSFKVVPNACLELIIHLDDLRCDFPGPDRWAQTPDYMLIGMITQVQEIRFRKTVPVFTIRFKPEALFTLFRLPGSKVLERYEDINDLLGGRLRDLCHRIREEKDVGGMIRQTETYLLQRLHERSLDWGYVNEAAEMMRRAKDLTVRDISEQVHVSQRQLERKFREIVGVSPKHYLRLTRINRVMKVLERGRPLDLTSVAYYCGYFDQAHFIKDFKRITGQNPTFYRRQRQQFIVLPGRVPEEA